MNTSKKSVPIITWGFFALFLVLSIIGVQNISDKITITFTLNGPNVEGSKYFIFVYPILSLIVGFTFGREGKKTDTKSKRSLLYLIIGNLVIGGLLVYTILTKWIM